MDILFLVNAVNQVTKRKRKEGDKTFKKLTYTDLIPNAEALLQWVRKAPKEEINYVLRLCVHFNDAMHQDTPEGKRVLNICSKTVAKAWDECATQVAEEYQKQKQNRARAHQMQTNHQMHGKPQRPKHTKYKRTR